MIELRNVRKWYGEVKAVDGISFTARPGEVFGLIGPNGAGKSTTIKMIMNILAPDSARSFSTAGSSGGATRTRSATCRKSEACTRR